MAEGGRLELYKSEAWMKKKFVKEKKTPEEIAELCRTSHMTIYRWLKFWGLMK